MFILLDEEICKDVVMDLEDYDITVRIVKENKKNNDEENYLKNLFEDKNKNDKIFNYLEVLKENRKNYKVV